MTTNIGLWNSGSNAIVVGNSIAVDSVTSALKASGANVCSVSHRQLVDENSVTEAFNAAEIELGGKIGILVFADALANGDSAEKLNLDAWHSITVVNMDIRFFCVAELARRCIADNRKGAILHLMSKAAERGEAGISAAVTSAGGVLNLNMSLAVEWGRDNIRSNIISSRLIDKADSKDQEQLDSLGTLAAYYCSDYASYISGTCVGIYEI